MEVEVSFDRGGNNLTGTIQGQAFSQKTSLFSHLCLHLAEVAVFFAPSFQKSKYDGRYI